MNKYFKMKKSILHREHFKIKDTDASLYIESHQIDEVVGMLKAAAPYAVKAGKAFAKDVGDLANWAFRGKHTPGVRRKAVTGAVGATAGDEYIAGGKGRQSIIDTVKSKSGAAADAIKDTGESVLEKGINAMKNAFQAGGENLFEIGVKYGLPVAVIGLIINDLVQAKKEKKSNTEED